MRATLGISRPGSTRSLLKAAVFVERERVVSAALAGLDADKPEVRAAHALKLLDATDPVPKAPSLSITADLDAEGVAQLGTADLLALAERMGIDPSPAT